MPSAVPGDGTVVAIAVADGRSQDRFKLDATGIDIDTLTPEQEKYSKSRQEGTWTPRRETTCRTVSIARGNTC
jgi:hypothetical protein